MMSLLAWYRNNKLEDKRNTLLEEKNEKENVEDEIDDDEIDDDDDDEDAVLKLNHGLLCTLGKELVFGNHVFTEDADLFSFYDGDITIETREFLDKEKTFFSSDMEMKQSHGILFLQQSAKYGNADAQYMMGVIYMHGLWNVKKDEALGITNLYFSSLGGSIAASMSLAYRHQNGLSVPKNCDTALLYYKVAAQYAIQSREEQPVAPIMWDQIPDHLSDKLDFSKNDHEVVEYYQYLSEKGDGMASHRLAMIYYYGIHGAEQDILKAFSLFTKAHEEGISAASSSLALMYKKGLGVRQDYNLAEEFFHEAIEEGSHQASNGLGEMVLHGLVNYPNGKPDVKKAMDLFSEAAKNGVSDAFYNLGLINLSDDLHYHTNYEKAHSHFQSASQYGNLLATHKLALMYLTGIGPEKSCDVAISNMQKVAKRGPWIMDFTEAFKAFEAQEYSVAFGLYIFLAEQGYQVGQYNAAYMLNSGLGYDAQTYKPSGELAVYFYRQSVSQGNQDAQLYIGDYYYYGKGGLDVNYEAAAKYYRLAARNAQNAQAMFNLAYMFEIGIGVTSQDFQLAKRWYDSAAAADAKAQVPVVLALIKLRVREWIVKLETLEFDDFFYKTKSFDGTPKVVEQNNIMPDYSNETVLLITLCITLCAVLYLRNARLTERQTFVHRRAHELQQGGGRR